MRNLLRMTRKGLPMVLTAGLLLGTNACNDEFLEVPATGQVDEGQLLSQAGLEGQLLGAYAAIDGIGGTWHGGAVNWLWGSIRGGDANKGTDAGDFALMNPVQRFELEPTNGEVNNKWTNSFEGVARVNRMLALLPEAEEVPEDVRTRLAAEGRFLRGHFYYELRKNFMMVPWIDETVDYAAGAEEIPNDTDIFPNIEADFQFAINNLPETQSELGRANSWAAKTYLAKVYMFQNKLAEAKPLFDDIIANGVTSSGEKYGLFPDFEELFTVANENSMESIFAFQATGGAQNVANSLHELAMAMPYNTAAGTEAPSDCCGFFQPSFDMAASYRTTADGLPLLDGSYRDPANELKNDQGVLSSAAFEPDQGPLDPRLDHTVGRRGIGFLDWDVHPGQAWIRDQSHAGPYTPKKYNLRKSEYGTRDASGWTPGYAATNFMILRFADVLLMAAEVEVEIGSLEQAREYVNMVRARAADPATFTLARDPNDPSVEIDEPAANYVISTYDAPWTDQAIAREAVRFERKLELSMEGKRFYDLLRWGILDEYINPYLAFENQYIPAQLGGATFQSNQDEFLPIPQRQIDLQGADILAQNPGFQ
ncbi:MAG: RagB/SusD family nutrient uptake outer membrane protein [Bacteroidota bacterium]